MYLQLLIRLIAFQSILTSTKATHSGYFLLHESQAYMHLRYLIVVLIVSSSVFWNYQSNDTKHLRLRIFIVLDRLNCFVHRVNLFKSVGCSLHITQVFEKVETHWISIHNFWVDFTSGGLVVSLYLFQPVVKICFWHNSRPENRVQHVYIMHLSETN